MQAILFRLQADEYAFEVSAVTEAVRMVALAALPDAPEWLAGVVNMRGHIMPVIDLRRCLHLPAPAPARHGAARPAPACRHRGALDARHR